ncbi:MAG: hydroxyacid dehydrogenase [Verrucomicrobiota bacterium]|jgi:D-lactate dehydrogenase|nr:hydroxyacid dehydrogenase [Verrucomicrobiota bacterium]
MTARRLPEPEVDLFCYEAFAEEAERLVHHAHAAGIRLGHTPATLQEAGHTAPPAACISIRTQSLLPVEWAPHLQGILSRSTGYDHLSAYQAAVQTPPRLGYLPLYCARSVAEQAMLLWTALWRRLPAQTQHFLSFDRDGLSGREIQGRRLALFGVGHIGYEIHRIATALGMHVKAVDPVRRYADVAYASAEEALEDAEGIVCAMNLTAENHGYFTLERLAQARRKPLLVNIARGELTPATVLRQALEKGLLSGIGLDVYNEEASLADGLRAGTTEAFTADNRALLWLQQQPECLCTPHNAFNTVEAVERKSEQTIRTFLQFQKNGAFLWPVPGSP